MAALKLFIVVYVTRQIFLNSVAQICFCNLLFKWRKLCSKHVITCRETIPSCNSSRTVDYGLQRIQKRAALEMKLIPATVFCCCIIQKILKYKTRCRE